MKNSVKEKIIEFVNSNKTNENLFNENNEPNQAFDDLHESVLDYLLDNDIVDLSDDEDGDMYEALSVDVYEFLEEFLL
jgi:hypothetical protein